MYRNEKGCGLAIRDSGIDRSELFYTTKILPSAMGYERTKQQIDSCLQESELEYIDLFVIHSLTLFHMRLTKKDPDSRTLRR